MKKTSIYRGNIFEIMYHILCEDVSKIKNILKRILGFLKNPDDFDSLIRYWNKNEKKLFIKIVLLLLILAPLSAYGFNDPVAKMIEMAKNITVPFLLAFPFFIYWRRKETKWYSLLAVIWGLVIVDLPHVTRLLLFERGLLNESGGRGIYHTIWVQMFIAFTVCLAVTLILMKAKRRKEYGNRVIFLFFAILCGFFGNFLVDLSVGWEKSAADILKLPILNIEGFSLITPEYPLLHLFKWAYKFLRFEFLTLLFSEIFWIRGEIIEYKKLKKIFKLNYD